MNTPKLWTKNFSIIFLVNFFVAINFFLLMVVISTFALDNFHSSPSTAGFASSIFVIGSLIARLFCGKWIEGIGRKKLLITGLVLSLVMTLFYFAVNSVLVLFLIRFLHGVGFGMTSTALGTIVASIIPSHRQGEGIGYFGLSVTLAMAIGPFLGMFLSRQGNFNMIFIASAISAVFSLVVGLFLSIPEIKLTKEQIKEMKGFKLSNFFESRAIPISIVSAVLYFCFSSVLAFLTAYSKKIALVEAASLFFITYAVVILFSRPFTGRLFDSKGENTTMYPAILIFSIGMLFLSQAHDGYSLLLAGAFIGFGLGVVQSSGQAISVKVTPPHRIGLATSTLYIFIDLSTGIGPFVLGLFIPFTGYRGMYFSMAMVAFLCMFLYYLLHGKNAMLKTDTSL